MMNKREMIDAIRELNPTAGPEFLVSFNEQVLQSYLDRLLMMRSRRGRQSVWVRPDGAPAMETRMSA